MKHFKAKPSYVSVFAQNFSSIKYIVASSIVGSAIAYNTVAMANPEEPSRSSQAEAGAATWELEGIGLDSSLADRFYIPETNVPLVRDLTVLANEGELTETRGTKTFLNPSSKGGSISEAFFDEESSTELTLSSGTVKEPNIDFSNLASRESWGEGVPVIDYRELLQIEPARKSGDVGGAAEEMAAPELPRWEISQRDADESIESEDGEALRQELLIPALPVALTPSTLGAAASPGSSSGSPTAFGADFGRFFVGASFQERTRFTESSDGSISAGFGLGNARKSVGLEVAVSVLDLSTRGGDDAAFDRGSFSFKLHRVLPNNLAVAVGYENGVVWGFTDAGSSVYGVVSKIFPLQNSPSKPFSSLTVSAGLGSGRFRSEDDFNNDEGTVNVFGSVGLRVVERVSAIADWTGQDLTLGASFVPFRNIPIVVTPAVADITGNAGDGARFILGVGYSRSFTF